MSKPTDPKLSRRSIFAGAGTVTALAGAAALLPAVRPLDAPQPAADAPSRDADGRYQLTEHVRRYYQTTRV